jgi:UDP-N-acetylmuramyl pentapeptide phosphotransferase/UDP-N-acetylglucosamine-1-phosphate transferase
MPSSIWFFAALGLVLSAGLTFAVGIAARRLSWFDFPTPRSAHSQPTPRIGGVAIIVAFLATALLLPGEHWQGPEIAAFVAILAVAILGLVDDVWGVSLVGRLAIQIVVAASFVIYLRTSGASPLLTADGMGGALAVPVAIVSIVWIMNAYNFMDGIDGLATGQTVIASLAVAIAAFTQGRGLIGCLMLLMASASLGFLPFNFPPATIFMGDVGATAIGVAFATLPLLPSASGVPVPVWLLAISMFLLDATATLVRRAVKGEDIFQAHRSHFYQRPLALGIGHFPISAVGWAAMLVAGACAIAWPGTTGWVRVLVTCLPIALFIGLATWVMLMERRHSMELRTLRAAESRG